MSSQASAPSRVSPETRRQDFGEEIRSGAIRALGDMDSDRVPFEGDAKRKALFGGFSTQEIAAEGATVDSASNSAFKKADQIFSFRAAFSGFICSLVDSAPSEIAVVSLKNFNALARWNALRTTDASVILSVGWLQVDNHVPSAPFPVAVRPDSRSRDLSREEDSSTSADQDGLGSPLLVVGLSFAPKHQSGIVVS